MEIDPRGLPPVEATDNPNMDLPKPTPAEDTTSKKTIADLEAKIAEKEKKLAEIQSQKDHWREKYDRDINKPKPSEEPDFLSDEEISAKRVEELENKLHKFETESKMDKLLTQYPILKDKLEEFNDFRGEYPGMDLGKIAKLFLVERDLLETPKPRPGLERPTAGSKTQPQGMTWADVDDLRNNHPRKYNQMIRSGQIDPDKIKE